MSGIDKKSNYEKPKIMIIDMPNSIVEKVKSLGFNAVSGTFGSPYKVELNDLYRPVSFNSSFHGLLESEILFLDLAKPVVIDDQSPPKIAPSADTFFVKCDTGEIDPRPMAMFEGREFLDRIYENGGIFIIFSAFPIVQTIYWGSVTRVVENDLKIDTWSFLSVLGNLNKRYDHGTEITVKDRNFSSIFPFLNDIPKDSFFNVVFETYVVFKEKNWTPLLWNKYDECIGGLILDKEKGLILILPQFSNKEEIIVKLLMETLPDLCPDLFPELVAGKWLERDDYEFETILQLKSERKKIEEEAAKNVKKIGEKIIRERERLGFLHGILIGTGGQLVKDTENTLKLIFDSVDNIDEQTPKDSNVQEDLQIKDKSEKILVEVKGLSGFPTESDIAQLNKYIARRMVE